MNEISLSWPPPFTVRASKRARYLSLQISPRKGLEVIVPILFVKNPRIHAFLETKRRWIERNLKFIKPVQTLPQLQERPRIISFSALQIAFEVVYLETHHKTISIIEDNETPHLICLRGPVNDIERVFKVLKKWIKQKAEQHLIPWLNRLSLENALPYSAVTIRSQSTLWGSCTSKKNINLNSKLLFLPPELVRYVLLHELCHTRYLSHGKRFWGLLAKFDSACLLHRRALRAASLSVPIWLDNPETVC